MGFLRRAIVVLVTVVYATVMTAPAMAATTGAITGSVHDVNGVAVAGADVSIAGPARATKSTDAKGAFAFNDIPPGLYTVLVSKAGYTIARNDGVAVFIGETETLAVTLTASLVLFAADDCDAFAPTHPASRRSIRPARRSTRSRAACSRIKAASRSRRCSTKRPAFSPRRIPRATAIRATAPRPARRRRRRFAARCPTKRSRSSTVTPFRSVRRERFRRTSSTRFCSTDVEIVKGPGSMPAEINYAINGTVNYRTLEPTPQNKFSGAFGVDKWGGVSTGFKATGSTKNHKIEYAAGYVTDGAPGALQNFQMQGSQILLDNGPPRRPVLCERPAAWQ